MQSTLEKTKHKYLIDEKGHKKAVVLDLKEYEHMLESIEDLEDANDLLKAEREATSFTPYEKFRKTWLKDGSIKLCKTDTTRCPSSAPDQVCDGVTTRN